MIFFIFLQRYKKVNKTTRLQDYKTTSFFFRGFRGIRGIRGLEGVEGVEGLEGIEGLEGVEV